MKKISKKITALLLALMLLFSVVPPGTITVSANGNTTLATLQAKYPHGKYWNGKNPDTYTSTPCTHHGSCSVTGGCYCNCFKGHAIQCMGFAYQLASLVYGGDPWAEWTANRNSSALNSLKAGDVVRYKNDGHSIFVTAVNGDTVTYADCNSDGHCIIRWNQTISKSTLKSTFTYVDVAPYAWDGGTSCTCSTSYAGKYICTTSSLDLTIRSGHGSSYSSVGSIPPGATVTVTKASGTSSSDWAHVIYNGVSGYASMQYLSKQSSSSEIAPVIERWFSYESMGKKISSATQGEYVYLCYKLFDLNSGKLLNELLPNRNYTAKLILYNPDGTIRHSNQVSNDDNSWIGTQLIFSGTYKYEVVMEGDWTGTYTGSLTVASNPKKVNVSTNSVNLTLGGTVSKDISVWGSGYYNGSITYFWERSNSNVSCSWGDWNNDGTCPLTFTANSMGTTQVTIGIKDKTSGKILDSQIVNINVTAKSYIVSYSANGGTGAPASQTKYHGTTLTLSNIKPTRTGYTFLGWSTSSSATSASYQPGDSFNINSSVPLYAVWKKGCEEDMHSYTYKVSKAPTTSENGTFIGTCSKCSGTTTVPIPKLSEVFYTYKIIKKPTCTMSGTGRYTMNITKYGDYYFDVTIPAIGHSYVSFTYQPTCNMEGYTQYICSECADCYNDKYVKAGGHSYTYKVSKAPTTSATGTLVGTCSKCSGTTTITLPKLSTADYSYAVTKKASYTQTGTGRYTWNVKTYGTFYFEVTLEKLVVSLSSISISNIPTKTTYYIGETLNTTGLTLKLVYSDGSTSTITSGFTTSGFSSTSAGTKTVTVSYGGKTTTFTVTVNSAPINKNEPCITVDSKTTRVGNKVSIVIKLQNNPGIWGMDLVINYDKSQLTLTNVSNGNVFSSSEWTQGNLAGNKYILSYEASGFDNITTNGILATLEFIVKDTATVNSFASISLSYNVGDIINVSFNDINVAIVAGGITITDFIYGDLNGDGLVNKKDSLLMKMYLADNETSIDKKAADVYVDRSINKKDSLYLKQYLAGLDVELGA